MGEKGCPKACTGEGLYMEDQDPERRFGMAACVGLVLCALSGVLMAFLFVKVLGWLGVL